MKRKEAAKTLGRLGGLKGGPARALCLTAEQRSEIARNAALARWGKKKVGAAPTKRFCVYALCRPDGSFFYVGAGTKRRPKQHFTKAQRGSKDYKSCLIREMWERGEDPKVAVLLETDDREEALVREAEIIEEHYTELVNTQSSTDSGHHLHIAFPLDVWNCLVKVAKGNNHSVKGELIIALKKYLYEGSNNSRTHKGD